MKKISKLFVLIFVVSCGGSSSSVISPIPNEPAASDNEIFECENYSGSTEKIIWLEDFQDSSYTNNWTAIIGNGAEYGIPGWGNNEKQYYTDNLNNVISLNGCLRITPLNQSVGGFNFSSAKLVTENKVDFSHPGKITVKFRSPEGVGLWPAIWMMPKNEVYGGWPASGEIDLVEIRGNNMQEILSTIHFGSNPANHSYMGDSYYLSQNGNLNENFHTMSLVWEEDSLKFILDENISVFEVTKSQIGFDENYPFNEIFYLIVNVAVGGNFVGNYIDTNDLCDINDLSNCSDKKRLLIDWVIYESL